MADDTPTGRKIVAQALDMLVAQLAAHEHVWTDEQLAAVGRAVQAIGGRTPFAARDQAVPPGEVPAL